MAEQGWQFAADAETGDTSQFDSITQEGSNTIAAVTTDVFEGSYAYKCTFLTATAGNDGCYGLATGLGNGTQYMRAYFLFPAGEYIYSETATLAAHALLWMGDSGFGTEVYLETRSRNNRIEVYRVLYDSTGTGTFAAVGATSVEISADDWHYIEVGYKKSTGASDGFVAWWLDDALQGSVSNHDNTSDIDNLAFGPIFGGIPADNQFVMMDACAGEVAKIGPYYEAVPDLAMQYQLGGMMR